MKSTYLIQILICSILILSCNEDIDPDGKCGGVEKFKHTKVNILDGNTFEAYKIYHIDGTAVHHTTYELRDVYAYFSVFTLLKDICTYEEVTINAQFESFFEVTEILDSVVIQEGGETQRILPMNSSGGLYSFTEKFKFKYHNNDSEVFFGHCVIFPSKGSYEADSLFLFSNFKKMTLESESKVK